MWGLHYFLIKGSRYRVLHYPPAAAGQPKAIVGHPSISKVWDRGAYKSSESMR